MIEDIIELLESLGFPVYRQGSLAMNASYDSAFFTIWNFDTPEDKHYDNQASRAIHGYWIYFYSTDVEWTNSILELAREILIENGYVSAGKGKDVASDIPTHTGRMIEVYYVENY